MKNIYLMLIAFIAFGVSFPSCKSEEPFSTITADDNPMILDPIFPDRVNGELPVLSTINHNSNFKMSVIVTPSEFTEVSWEIDQTEVCKGTSIDVALEAGVYHLKVKATTVKGKSTSREAKIQVNHLDEEPWSEAVGVERIVVPSSTARLYGINLASIVQIKIGATIVSVVAAGTSPEGEYLEYVVPTGITDGEYRVSLIDASNNSFGANTVTVTTTSVITDGFKYATSGGEWTMTGLGLDKITSFNVNGQSITDFVRKSDSEVVIVCPTMEDGVYTLKAKATDNDVLFYNGTALVSEASFAVISETILWEGHHYVSWDLADGDPNKMFNLIAKSVFESIIPGSKMSVYYSIAPEATYHQLRTTTGWWNDLAGTSTIEFQENGVAEVLLTAEVLSSIKSEDGFLCIGHGYYVDKISIK